MASRGNLIGLAALGFAILLSGRTLDDYTLGALVLAGLYALNALGLSLLTGFAGQVSIGQAAFFGTGAYVLGILTTRTSVPLPVAWAAAIGAAMLLAVAVGLPSLRLRGHYLAMATLAFGEIFFIVVNADPGGLTGGPSGFGRIPRLSLGPWEIRGEQAYFYVCWALVWTAILIGINIVHSRTGRALRALHISESAARSLGVNIGRLKIQVFVLSALLSAAAGCLYAHFVTFLSPTGFSLLYSIRFITMAAIGGMANLWGAVAGATFLALLPEQLRFLHDYEALVYGGILMLLMIYCPSGILGWIRLPPALRSLGQRVRRTGKETS
jgi:branched-chain amino acid transport system permease protein